METRSNKNLRKRVAIPDYQEGNYFFNALLSYRKGLTTIRVGIDNVDQYGQLRSELLEDYNYITNYDSYEEVVFKWKSKELFG
jgi:hypothetical protein